MLDKEERPYEPLQHVEAGRPYEPLQHVEAGRPYEPLQHVEANVISIKELVSLLANPIDSRKGGVLRLKKPNQYIGTRLLPMAE